METNTPEKIYLSIYSGLHHYEQKNDDDIEYTRTDAFIKELYNWLLKNRSHYSTNALGVEYLIEDFKNYIKGE